MRIVASLSDQKIIAGGKDNELVSPRYVLVNIVHKQVLRLRTSNLEFLVRREARAPKNEKYLTRELSAMCAVIPDLPFIASPWQLVADTTIMTSQIY